MASGSSQENRNGAGRSQRRSATRLHQTSSRHTEAAHANGGSGSSTQSNSSRNAVSPMLRMWLQQDVAEDPFTGITYTDQDNSQQSAGNRHASDDQAQYQSDGHSNAATYGSSE